MPKLKVGWFSFTCSEDSTIVFIEIMNRKYFEWKNLVDFRYFRTLKSGGEIKDLDAAFVEGAISGDEEEEMLKEIRKHCRKLVAVGNCACIGVPSNQRNFFDKNRMDEIKPIIEKFGLKDKVRSVPEVVEVDEKVPGCPMDEEKFLAVFERLLKEFGVSNA